MDNSVIKTSETTSAAGQSSPDPVLQSMHAIARQQYEFEQSLLSQQLWSQQQAVSMEVSIKAVALQAAIQANGISDILKGRNDISKEEVVKEIQTDRVIEELKLSWKTPSWHSSASNLTSGSPMGHKDELKAEDTHTADGSSSERHHHKDNPLDNKDTHQEFHVSKDRRNCLSDYRSHRLHQHRRSRTRSQSRDRSGVRSSSRSRSRYLSGLPPKKYNKDRSISRSRTSSRYKSRSPPKKRSRDEYYSHGPEDLKSKSTCHQWVTHRTSSGGPIKSGVSHGDNYVQTHSATPWNGSSEQDNEDLLTKDNDACKVEE